MIDNYDIQDAYESLREIKTRTGNNIDGEVLYAALSLLTWAGMEKKEVVSAKIQDIVYDGDNIVGINLNSDNEADLIRLFGHPKRVFTEYLQYLNNNEDYDTNPDSPLFPGYIGESGKQNLYRHMKNLGETYTRWCNQYEWELGFLKEIGRSDYYLKKKESEVSEELALEETATQFRIGNKQVKDSISEKSQNSRRRIREYHCHWDKMYGLRGLDFSNEGEIQEYKEEAFRLIKRLPYSTETKLSTKQSFLSDLAEAREDYFRKQSEERKKTPKLSDREEFRKKYDELTPTEEIPSPHNLDWTESMWRDDCNDKYDQEKSDEDDQDISDKN